ncbi:MAG: DNA replication/repair protein RecF [Christensenellaceae bacterium]|jgi:DNA replication and repair protein RecF|nr:DNA replication/repair protein RecF [Christensenellaceae bacterium]
MKILSLTLLQFRNYEEESFSPAPGVNILLGENAQGKTNLLEAIFLCCLGRSHRTPRERELIRYEQPLSSVLLRCEKGGVTRTIRVSLSQEQRRRVFLDSLPVQNIGELMGQLNCVLFAPEHLSIVKQGPSERRRFIDMEISQTYPSYFYALQQYAHILRQRNNLLKALSGDASLLSTLPAWDEQMAKTAAFLIRQRRLFLEKLSALARRNHLEISGQKEELLLKYEPNLGEEDPAAFLSALERGRKNDLRLLSSQIGPHRDDFALFLNGKDLRSFGSQGQQRTAALALKLSELDLIHQETGEWPVLMLDDVLSELDAARQGFLLERVLPVQTFLTTALSVEKLRGVSLFLVENGHVRQV